VESRQVDKYNKSLQLRVTPIATRTASGSTVGVGISGSF
jgi:hypothetical protein